MNNEWGSGTYRGPIVNGKAEGFGTWTCTDGDVYKGHFKDHRFHGQGTYTFAIGCTFSNGCKYIGAWENGQRHGQGTFTFANGDQYIGAWENDKRHGLGTQTSADGSIDHSGLWKKGCPVHHHFSRPMSIRLPC
jgi:hypothetical protein